MQGDGWQPAHLASEGQLTSMWLALSVVAAETRLPAVAKDGVRLAQPSVTAQFRYALVQLLQQPVLLLMASPTLTTTAWVGPLLLVLCWC